MDQTIEAQIFRIVDSSIENLNRIRRLSPTISNIAEVTLANVEIVNLVRTTNQNYVNLTNEIQNFRQAMETFRGEMHAQFEQRELISQARMANSSCLRNNSRIYWIRVILFIFDF